MYIKVDVNDYTKKKIEYLKSLAQNLADEAVKVRQNRLLPPMSPYERRIIHTELSQRKDVATESQGLGEDRCVVIRLV